MLWYPKTIFFSSLALLFCSFCTSSLSSRSVRIMDPPLRQFVESDTVAAASFSGICFHEITAQEKEQMHRLGIEVRTVTKNMFTASGTREQIIQLSHKSWVKKLQLSKKVRLLRE